MIASQRRRAARGAHRDQTSFAAGNPTVLLEGRHTAVQCGRGYDVSPDGKRFLMLKENGEPSAAPKIVIVENWSEELKRLVPTE